ncbi:hypothetical protein ACVIYL_007293 [Bradyrhizobium sp. USDA 3315]
MLRRASRPSDGPAKLTGVLRHQVSRATGNRLPISWAAALVATMEGRLTALAPPCRIARSDEAT